MLRQCALQWGGSLSFQEVTMLRLGLDIGTNSIGWWLYEIACPSRSGDAKLIAWHRGMLHLFYTLYRGGGFVLILEHALENVA
jgi:hypothetical protein